MKPYQVQTVVGSFNDPIACTDLSSVLGFIGGAKHGLIREPSVYGKREILRPLRNGSTVLPEPDMFILLRCRMSY